MMPIALPANRIYAPRRLTKPVIPQPGESLRGLVARACFDNFLPNSWGLLKPLGLRNRNLVNISELDDISTNCLATALGVDADEVARRRYPFLGEGCRSFFGIEVSRLRIATRVRRFAPATLVSKPWHLAVWELHDLPFCPLTWGQVIEECPCPLDKAALQRWTRTSSNVTHCDSCGEDLTRLPAAIIPPANRQHLWLLSDILAPALGAAPSPERLPEVLRPIAAGRIFEAVTKLSKIMPAHPIHGLPAEFASAVSRLDAACNAVLNWPNGLDLAHVDPKTTNQQIEYYKPLYASLGDHPRASLVDIKKLFRLEDERRCGRPKRSKRRQSNVGNGHNSDAIIGTDADGHASQGGRQSSQPSKPVIGLRPASGLARLDPETLSAAQDHGLLKQLHHRHGDKIVRGFDRAEVAEFGKLWRSRNDLSQIAYGLAISRYGLEQIIALGLLIPDIPALDESGPGVSQTVLDDFRTKLARRAAPIDEESTSLQKILFQINDRPKPWGPILKLLLDGSVRFGMHHRDHMHLGKLQIAHSDVPAILSAKFDREDFKGAHFSSAMVQRDVCECLNILPKHGKHICFLPHKDGMPRMFQLEDIEAFRLRMIGAHEIGLRLGINPRTVKRLLSERDASPTHWRFYDRAAVQPFLSQLL